MNEKERVVILLDHWKQAIKKAQKRIPQTVSGLKHKEDHVVTQSSGKVVALDHVLYEEQVRIQGELSDLMPSHRPLLSSAPALDGSWPAKDYLELCLSHYEILIDKLLKIAEKGTL